MYRVVITGIGIVAPNASKVSQYWDNIFSSKVFVDEDIDMKIDTGLKSSVNCKITDFYIDNYLSNPEFKEEISKQARFIQMGVSAGVSAVEDAGFCFNKKIPTDCAVVFSSAIGGTPTIQTIYEGMTKNNSEVQYSEQGEYFYNAGMINYPSTALSRYYGLSNICTAMSTGCTGGVDSIGTGLDIIKSGQTKIVLAGSTEAPLCKITYATLDAIGALSVAEGDPKTRSRPFDKTRAGFVIAEGAACLILEELESAKARNAKIYGEVLGYSSVNNGNHMTDLIGDGKDMIKAIQLAIEEAGIEFSDIDYINAHGSSTIQNDLYETNVFKTTFGERAYKIPISSVKSMIGHSLASASAMGSIAVLGSFSRGKIHPTANLRNKDEHCDLNYVPNSSIDANVNIGMVTASGFGGIHSICVLKKYKEDKC